MGALWLGLMLAAFERARRGSGHIEPVWERGGAALDSGQQHAVAVAPVDPGLRAPPRARRCCRPTIRSRPVENGRLPRPPAQTSALAYGRTHARPGETLGNRAAPPKVASRDAITLRKLYHTGACSSHRMAPNGRPWHVSVAWMERARSCAAACYPAGDIAHGRQPRAMDRERSATW